MAGKVMRSTGTSHRQLEFGEEEVVEDLFIEGRSLLDRSTEQESSEFDRLLGKVMRCTGTTNRQQELGEEELVEDQTFS